MTSKYTTIGYHGTSRENAESILRDKCFYESDRKTDWLGKGVYFFAYFYHAKWWTTHKRFNGIETSILCADLEYTKEQLLDLDDPSQIEILDAVVKATIEKGNGADNIAKANVSETDRWRRWCFACNIYKKFNSKIGIIKHTFPFKGHEFPCSGFYGNQQQLCVSERSIITSIENCEDM